MSIPLAKASGEAESMATPRRNSLARFVTHILGELARRRRLVSVALRLITAFLLMPATRGGAIGSNRAASARVDHIECASTDNNWPERKIRRSGVVEVDRWRGWDPKWLAENTIVTGALTNWFDVLIHLREVTAGHPSSWTVHWPRREFWFKSSSPTIRTQTTRNF